jgi:hypothetical protein
MDVIFGFEIIDACPGVPLSALPDPAGALPAPPAPTVIV